MKSSDAICDFCSKKYAKKKWNQRFCSPDCMVKYVSKKRRARRLKTQKERAIEKVCLYCKKEFISHYVYAKYCSEECKNGHAWAQKSEKWINAKPRYVHRSFAN